VRMQFTAFCRSCFRLTRTRSVFVFLCFDFRHDFVPPTDCRHRATGKYEAHLWDAHCWSSAQNKKGKQGETQSLGFYLPCLAIWLHLLRLFFFTLMFCVLSDILVVLTAMFANIVFVCLGICTYPCLIDVSSDASNSLSG
jgi:hypothetical protein